MAYEYLKNVYLILFFHVFPELFINRNEYGMQNRQSSYSTTTFTRLRTRIDGCMILNICCYENFTTLSTPKNCFSSEHDIRRNWSDYFGSLFSMDRGCHSILIFQVPLLYIPVSLLGTSIPFIRNCCMRASLHLLLLNKLYGVIPIILMLIVYCCPLSICNPPNLSISCRAVKTKVAIVTSILLLII